MSTQRPITAGISGKNLPEIRDNPGNQRFTFTPAVTLPGGDDPKRYIVNPMFVDGTQPGCFTLSGHMGGTKVTVRVTGYCSNGPDSHGEATIEVTKAAIRPAASMLAEVPQAIGSAHPAK
jgi:hypothetical protein